MDGCLRNHVGDCCDFQSRRWRTSGLSSRHHCHRHGNHSRRMWRFRTCLRSGSFLLQSIRATSTCSHSSCLRQRFCPQLSALLGIHRTDDHPLNACCVDHSEEFHRLSIDPIGSLLVASRRTPHHFRCTSLDLEWTPQDSQSNRASASPLTTTPQPSRTSDPTLFRRSRHCKAPFPL